MFFVIISATWVGGGFTNGTAESVYVSGLVWAQAAWCYSASLIIGGLIFAKKMREKGYVTMVDPLQEKFSPWMGGLLYIPGFLGEIMYVAAILGALGSTLGVILDLNIDLAVIFSAVIAVGYTCFGGLYSVMYTDVLQLGFIFVGLWLSTPFIMKSEHATVASESWVGTLEKQQVGEWIDLALLLTIGGMPWQAYFQRVLSSKSPERAQILSIVGGFGCLVLSIPPVLIGAIAKSTDWSSLNISFELMDDNSTLADSRLVLPLVMQYLTPQWVSFLGLGAISAAVMSSADSTVLSASSIFGYNIYKLIIRPKASERELVWVIRIGIFFVGALSTVMALTIKSIYTLWALCSDLVYVIMFPQLLCAIYVPSVNTYGSFLAFAIGLILRFGGGEPTVGLPSFIKYPLYDENLKKQLFPFRTLSMLVSLVTLILVSYAAEILFKKFQLSKRFDVFHVFKEEKEDTVTLKRFNGNQDEIVSKDPNDNSAAHRF
eukprot:gene10362-19064_t